MSSHHQHSRGGQYALSLGQRPCRVFKVSQHPHHEHHIKAGVREGQGVGVGALQRVDQFTLPIMAPAFQLTQQAALSPTDVQHTGRWTQLHGVQQGRKGPHLTAHPREQRVTLGEAHARQSRMLRTGTTISSADQPPWLPFRISGPAP